MRLLKAVSPDQQLAGSRSGRFVLGATAKGMKAVIALGLQRNHR